MGVEALAVAEQKIECAEFRKPCRPTGDFRTEGIVTGRIVGKSLAQGFQQIAKRCFAIGAADRPIARAVYRLLIFQGAVMSEDPVTAP